MIKKVVSILLCAMVLFNSFEVVHATDSETIQINSDYNEEDYLESRIDNTVFEWGNPTPFYDHVASTFIGLGIFGNEAECNLAVTGYSEVTKISTYIYLQRYVLGKWTTISGGSFRKEVNSDSIFFAPTKVLDTIGTYRFTTQIFVYANDGTVELIEHASNTAVY